MTEDERKLAYIDGQMAAGRTEGFLKGMKADILRRLRRGEATSPATPVTSEAPHFAPLDAEAIAGRMAAAGRKAAEGDNR